MKPTYRKSWAGNFLMWLDLTLSPSFKVKRVQPILKVLIIYLLLILDVCICIVKSTCRISWARNLLMLSDLTFGFSFKVKRWCTGFGWLSFWWIQICIGSPMRRSSIIIGPRFGMSSSAPASHQHRLRVSCITDESTRVEIESISIF